MPALRFVPGEIIGGSVTLAKSDLSPCFGAQLFGEIDGISVLSPPSQRTNSNLLPAI
jgi:hypothetical protein